MAGLPSCRSTAASAALAGGALLAPGLLFVAPGSLQGSELSQGPQPRLRGQAAHGIPSPPAGASAMAAAAGPAAMAACLAARASQRQRGPARRGATPTGKVTCAAVIAPPTDGVRLTGETLQASLKMRCDTSGAGYSILWLAVNDELVVAGDYLTPAHKAALADEGKSSSYAERSEKIKLSLNGDGPVASVYKTGEPVFIADAKSCDKLKRQKLAAEYGIESICFVPCEGGVLEFGTSKGPATATWTEMPQCPVMPKREIRTAFENLGAKYVMFWEKQGDEFAVIADYVSAERVEALKNRRKDDKTFCSESRAFKLSADSDGPVATAARTGEESFVIVEDSNYERADLAKEFGVKMIHCMPVPGGVLEYGIPEDARLTGNTLAASLKMCCDNSGAGYALYWIEQDGRFVVAGSYVPPARLIALKKKGIDGSFSEAYGNFTLPADGAGPVATAYKTGKPTFIKDAPTSSMRRVDFAKTYGITSICFLPVECGVLEFGTSNDGSTADWGGEAPQCPEMPKAEMKHAFDEDEAKYVMFWEKKGDSFEVTADFLIPERLRALRNQRGDDKTFCSESRGYKLPADGDGYMATTARSGKAFVLEDPASDPKFRRAELAKEFGISNIHLVPCKDGVLEYGVAPAM